MIDGDDAVEIGPTDAEPTIDVVGKFVTVIVDIGMVAFPNGAELVPIAPALAPALLVTVVVAVTVWDVVVVMTTPAIVVVPTLTLTLTLTITLIWNGWPPKAEPPGDVP